MPSLLIRVVGPPEILIDGAALDVDTRKAIAILVLVAVDGPKRRETLASLLWPESDASRARGALRRTLSVLKNALPDATLSTSRDTVGLEPGTYNCDVDTFRSLVAEARAHHDRPADVCDDCLEALERAVALHRGEFLNGFAVRGSPDFEDWQYRQSDDLRRELATSLDQLVNALVHRGDMAAAIRHAQRRLALDQLHEPTHRRLMLLHAWAGGREDAIRQYRACVAVLEAELRVSPLDETSSLYEAILAGNHPPPPTTGPESIPAQVGTTAPAADDRPRVPEGAPETLPLAGRDRELEELIGAYAATVESGRLCIVEGEAGIGKTRILEELARRVRAEGGTSIAVRCYPGEEHLAYAVVGDALRGVMTDGKADLSPSWLVEIARLVPELRDRHPDLPPAPPLDSPESRRRFLEGVRQGLATNIGTRAALLVIDDAHWADSASQEVLAYLAHRLEGLPLCLVLSWRTGEVGRDHALRRLSSELRAAPATTHLVLERLPHQAVALLAQSAGVGDGETVTRLHAETEGLPLFLVEYLHALQVGQLDDSDWDLPAGLRDLLEERVARMSDTARQVLTTAAVIGRSFDLDTLLRASGRAEEESVDAIEELVASGFVREDTDARSGSAANYDFRHHRLRSVVYDAASIARRRLLHGRVADALLHRSRSGDSPPDAVIGTHLRLAGRDDEASRAFARAGDSSRDLSAHRDAVEHYRAALALGHPEPGRLHEAIGDLLTLLGDYSDALNSLVAAAAVSDDPATRARLERKIAGVHQRRGDWTAAAAHIETALASLPEGADLVLRARLEVEAGLAAFRGDEPRSARERLEHGLVLAEDGADPLARAQAHNVLGMIARTDGDLEQALAHLRAGLEIAEALDDPTPRIAVLNNLALTFTDGGDVPEALEMLKTALALCRHQGDRHREAALLNNLADLLHAAGQEAESQEHLRQAVSIFASIGEPDRPEPEIWKLVDW